VKFSELKCAVKQWNKFALSLSTTPWTCKFVGWRYSSTHSSPRQQMIVCYASRSHHLIQPLPM